MEGSRTQRITAKDIAGGRIRIPHQTKRLFPPVPARIHVDLLGRQLDCRWDPKHGPDKERSGVIGIGRHHMAGLIEPDEVLFVSAADGGVQVRRTSESLARGHATVPKQPDYAPRSTVATARAGGSPTAPEAGRRLREEAAALYQPKRIKLLLVAEAPPSAQDRYFYFPEVRTQDSLFRYVVRLVLGTQPDRRTKPEDLSRLQAAGAFLIDLCLEPISERRDLARCVPGLVKRAAALRPDHIILIKTRVYDAAWRALQQAGLPVIDARIPFPGSGQQRLFEQQMQHALDAIGWVKPGDVQR